MHNRLETLRQALRLQWGELAARLNLSRSMLDQVRRDRRKLSIKAIRRLEEAERDAGIEVASCLTVREEMMAYGANKGDSTRVSKRLKIGELKQSSVVEIERMLSQLKQQLERMGDGK